MRLILIASLFLMASIASANEGYPLWRLNNDSQEITKDKILEFWGYHNYQGNDDYNNTLKLRYYDFLQLESWRGRIRLDTSVVSNYGANEPANSAGQYSAGNTMLTIWGQDIRYLKTLNSTVGARLTLPFGNNGQWAIGPQVGWIFRPASKTSIHLADFSPLVRYMYGFDTKNNSFVINPNQPALQRNLQIYPTLGFQLSPNTQLRLWDENGAIYNSAGGSWFVPIDAMVTHRLSKNFLVAIGASKQIVQTYQQYDWSLYGKVSFNF